MNIIWYDTAQKDMDGIYDFYCTKNPNAALRIYHSILREVDILRSLPYIAAVDPFIDDEEVVYRSLIMKDGVFKVVYFVDGEDVVIVRVWCCRADPKKFQLLP